MKQNSDNERILAIIDKYEHVLWDWNGTLINDVETAVFCLNQVLLSHQQASITIQQYRELFDFPISKFYQKLGIDFSKVSFELIRGQYIEAYNANAAKRASLFPQVPELLQAIARQKRQYILSAVSQKHLDEVTVHFNLETLFDQRFGLADHFASSKLERGRELLSQAKVSAKQAILIGDTQHDYEVASSLGLDCLIIANGHQSLERLQNFAPLVIQRN